jgi:uncharacterized repeat protein (TIGR01451 family)
MCVGTPVPSCPALQADLALTKTADRPTSSVGDTITFTVTLSNNGPAAATAVLVTDQLPAGLTFQSATPSQGTYASTTGLWTVGTVMAGTTQTLVLAAQVASASAFTNIATITHADQTDPNPANNTASATVTPQPADLALRKTSDRPTASVGDTVTFTVTLSNNGPGTATNVQVIDPLPAGLAFVSATPSQGTYGSVSGLWTVGTVAAGATQTLVLVTHVATADVVTNIATIASADQVDPNPANNTASATVAPQLADLALTKSVDDPLASVGDTIRFTITLSNNGPGEATSVQVFDPLPVGLTFVSATPSQGTYGSVSGLWTVGTVAAGSTQTLVLAAQVAIPDPLTNVATIAHADQVDPNPANNTASATVAPQQADLALTKTADRPTASVGDMVTFTVTLSNNGPGTATSVQVFDPLPVGLTFVSATPSQGTYGSVSGQWTVGTVAAGSTQTLVLVAQVATPDPVTNIATIASADQVDPNPANNTASATVAPQLADLALTKAVDNPTASVGDTVTFTITLSSNGPGEATGVQVFDPLPAGLSFVSATPSLGTYGSVSGLWTVGTVAAGETQTLVLVAQVAAADSLTNIATIAHADQIDPNPANNTASATVTAQ